MKKDLNPNSNPSEFEKLKVKLAIEEGQSHIKAYPDYPRDAEGNIISDKKTSETVKAIAGSNLGKNVKEIRDKGRLAKEYGGNESDWVKLSSKARDVNDKLNSKERKLWEVHGYKNGKTGEVRELKAVDVTQRSTDAKKSTSKSKNMDNKNPNKETPSRGELTKEFNKNASDISNTKKSESDSQTPKHSDFQKKGEVQKNGELMKKFNESAKDITKTDAKKGNFDKKAFGSETPKHSDFQRKGEVPKNGELTNKFNESAKDITKSNSEKGNSEKKGDPPPKAELKPKLDRPKFH